jgi:looped-hinge helix DNA binding domain, AbrB family
MKENIIVRRVDDLGRFVLPIDVRKKLNIRTGDYLELSVENDTIHMEKYSCIQGLEYIVKIIINSIYEIYKTEVILIEDDKIILKRDGMTEDKINNLMKEKESILGSIVIEGKEIGRLIVLSDNEDIKVLTEFISLFLRKYLEQ